MPIPPGQKAAPTDGRTHPGRVTGVKSIAYNLVIPLFTAYAEDVPLHEEKLLVKTSIALSRICYAPYRLVGDEACGNAGTVLSATKRDYTHIRY